MDYPASLDAYRERVEEALCAAIDACEGPSELVDAMRYSLMAGGKRLRPVLLLVAKDMFDDSARDPMPAACSLEFVHTYSLIHDDLPALDDDDLRRNRPSCHKRFDEATAILAGDGLLNQAFQILAGACAGASDGAWDRVTFEIARAAGPAGMLGGQALDTLGTGTLLSRSELERVHRMKTGALITAAVRCGAILGGAEEDSLEALTRCAEDMGLAFQVVDDLLDVVGTRETLGKTIGKDEARNKTTYVTLMGVEGAREYARSLAAGVRSGLTSDFHDRAATLIDLSDFIVGRVF